MDEYFPCVSNEEENKCQLSVEVIEAVYLYGKGENAQGLRGVNLRIPKGTIYALLGPSGCGKTTLLRSLVGLQRLQSGQNLVFGKTPGTRSSGIPGPWIGYMPQDICLYPDLTAENHLKYFGSLYGFIPSVLQERSNFLLKLLELSPKQKVGAMSGGQQRRLSLAVALVHDPPLLVLDEPTVGVDPCLRNSIWNYLKQLPTTKGTTILFSTHHTEEASKRANTAGFMREGRILVEGNPQWLMNQSKVTNMEEVFLQQCVNDVLIQNSEPSKKKRECWTNDLADGTIKTKDYSALQNNANGHNTDTYYPMVDMDSGNLSEGNKSAVHSSVPGTSGFQSHALDGLEKGAKDIPTEMSETLLEVRNQPLPEVNRSMRFVSKMILTIFMKNLKLYTQNFGLLVIALSLPLSNILCCKLILSSSPYNLRLAIVNNDEHPIFSKTFIENIDNETFSTKFYPDLDTAVELVRTGKIHAVLHFGARYSSSLLLRVQDGLNTSNSTIKDSVMRLYTNNDNLLVIRSIQASLYQTYEKVTKDALQQINANPEISGSPLKFEEPVLGSKVIDYSTVTALNLHSDGIFTVSLAVATLFFVGERSKGLLERNRVSGIKAEQMIASHALMNTLITAGQIILLLLYLAIFQVKVKGSISLLIFLLYQNSYFGMALGIFASQVARNTFASLLMIVGILWIGSFLAALFWPIEGQRVGLREFSQIHPGTWNYNAVSRVINYGMGIKHIQVWRSVLLSAGWTIGLLILSILLLRRRS